PTVGRLVWSLTVEQAFAARDGAHAPAGELERLHAAERAIEHATYWDLGMVLAGYARLGHRREAERVAGPLAARLAAELAAEPALHGRAARALLAHAGDAARAIATGDAAAGHAALAPLLADATLRRYRIPCAHCGRGSVGLEAWEEPVAP
ncbi:MAG TPA: hypothetical protein VMH61_02735, partial [Candidatus Acidoferrales bacterium]|nr:hypothetical protein [Candidatus Acidoferrales bacterium]